MKHTRVTLKKSVIYLKLMVKAFSFCLYGDNKKYCQGLTENLKLIAQYYPEFEVHIVTGNDVPTSYLETYQRYPQVRLHSSAKTGGSLMSERFLLVDHPEFEVCFVRDADSRINERDRWCINAFLQSEALVHIIRDHPYHARRIMGGMWGLKKGVLDITLRTLYEAWVQTRKVNLDVYQSDQDFLEECVYPRIRDRALIHTNYHRYPDETINPITYPSDGTNFVGNVVDFHPDDSEYFVFRL